VEKRGRLIIFLLLAYALTYAVFRYVFDVEGIYPLYTPGWTGRHLLWMAALVSIGAALLGLSKTALFSYAGFLLGNLFGELFGGLWSKPPQFLHYGWLICIVVFVLAALMGYSLDKRAKGQK
jgi:hypothetical protein